VGMLPPPVGGQALMFKRAIDALSKYYDVKVINAQFQKNLGESGVFSVRKVLHFFVLLFGTVIPLALTQKFDILYYCLSGPSRLGLIKDLVFLSLLRSRARKTIFHLHGAGGITLLMQWNAFVRAWARLVLFEPDLVLRPGSRFEEATLCRAKREIIVDNCIEDPMGMIANSVPRWPDGDLIFAFIGLLTEDKGIFDLIEIARLLRYRGHRFKLYMVGEGLPEEIARLNDLVLRYDLSEFVQLTGVLMGVQKFTLLQKATIFLFPTYFRAETQPTVLMEALAVGVPVVAYDWRGINTIIDQGVNGYLVPVRDTEAFCQAVEKILIGGVDQMRIAARRIFLERFTLDRHVEALRRAFHSVEIDGEAREKVST
jgi:glycosyltransferase involved in cell wall biosynthesis